MAIKSLEIADFRNFKNSLLEPGNRLNLLCGKNGAGKTSILETITVLSSLKSFRSSNLSQLTRHGSDGFLIRALVTDTRGQSTRLGMQRNGSNLVVKADGERLSKTSELSKKLPVQIIHPDSHLLVSGGPKQRRRFLDWGVFHVEHRFLSAWRRYDKALKQRNAALRSKLNRKAIEIWNVEMGSAAQEIDGYRQKYISELQQTLPKFARSISGAHEINIEYRKGWDSGQDLQEVLNNTFPNDWNRGFTCSGPHRAELVFRMDGRQADNFVSRGQQKMLVFALLLSQVQLYYQHVNEACVILLDDLASELDFQHQEKVLECLGELGAQVLITAIERDAIPCLKKQDISLFHVEHGRIEEVL